LTLEKRGEESHSYAKPTLTDVRVGAEENIDDKRVNNIETENHEQNRGRTVAKQYLKSRRRY
jgi:hypothetical protein